jgi:hypothetical protein
MRAAPLCLGVDNVAAKPQPAANRRQEAERALIARDCARSVGARSVRGGGKGLVHGRVFPGRAACRGWVNAFASVAVAGK